MTKKELFEIDTKIDKLFVPDDVNTLIHYFYDNYYEEFFSVYKKDTLFEFASCLIMFCHVRNLSLDIHDPYNSKKIDEFIKKDIDITKKFLKFYDKCNNNFLLNLVDFKYILYEILLTANIDNPFKKWLSNEKLDFDNFINDLIVLNEIYENYYVIGDACDNYKLTVGELAELHKGGVYDQTRLI